MKSLRLATTTALICLAPIRTEAQQVVTSAQATANAPIATDNSLSFAPRPSAEMRQIFKKRAENIREHHRPTPFQGISPQAFTQLLMASPTPPPPTNVTPAVGSRASAAPTIQFGMNRALTGGETNKLTGVVGEPSVAVRGKEILYTANWFASYSKDGGENFSYVDPTRAFPAPTNEEFCCDQLAYFDAKRDLMVWVLQYISPGTQGTNRLRIAVSRGAHTTTPIWRFYDFTPQNVGGWTDEWFDYPAIAASDSFLHLTTNSFGFGSSGGFVRSIVMRLPLEELANYQGFGFQYFATSEVGSIRPVHGGTKSMYLASHISAAKVRVYEWPDSSSSLTIRDVNVSPWSRTNVSVVGTEWLGRADGRLTAGWFANGRIGLAWTAGKDDTYPHAHVRVVRIDPNTWTAVDQPHIWNSTFPYAYPSAAPNARGQVGVAVVYGTVAGLYPSHAVGTRNDPANAWELVIAAEGNASPERPVWGDYFTMGLHGQNTNDWVTAAFTLDGGNSNEDVVQRYIHFRAENLGSAVSSQPAPK